mgnify:FL=1
MYAQLNIYLISSSSTLPCTINCRYYTYYRCCRCLTHGLVASNTITGIEATSDFLGAGDAPNLSALGEASVILTTPEKWDSITRKAADKRSFCNRIQLVMLDEVQVLNEQRGATLEAIVSRMKTVAQAGGGRSGRPMRFVAVSATCPNIEDIARWLDASVRTCVSAMFARTERERESACANTQVLYFLHTVALATTIARSLWYSYPQAH